MNFKALIGGIGGQVVEISVESLEGDHVDAVIDGRQYRLELREVEAGVFWFNVGSRPLEAAVSRKGSAYAVRIGESDLEIEILGGRTHPRGHGRSEKGGLWEVRAPMPGRVVKLLVAPGTEVQAHQGLMVIEAMKMQNEIKSPTAGVVLKTEVVEGAVVEARELLATVEC